MTLSVCLDRAIERWNHSGVELLPSVDGGRIRALLRAIDRRASADLIQLYETTGGFAGGCDEHIWSLWSLDRVVQANGSHGRIDQIAFSDGLIDSFYYYARYENEYVSSVWIDHLDGEFVRVSESLADFFTLYLTDPDRINLV